MVLNESKVVEKHCPECDCPTQCKCLSVNGRIAFYTCPLCGTKWMRPTVIEHGRNGDQR